jgi:peptide/nickel transport system permease protein
MIAYVARRLVFMVLILIAVSMLVFGVTALLPANVAYLILGPFASPEQVHALELKLGLTDPVWQQYLRWAGGFLSGDLGESTLMNRPIAPLLAEAIARSLILTGVSFVLIALIGVGLGIVAALRHGRPLDHGISVATYLGIAVPEFFWAIVVIIVFAAWLGWLPASGYEPLSAGVWIWAKHLIAPTLTLVFGHLAHVSRLTRSSMIEVMQSPYVTAARAKGLPERVVVLHHALRNALLPTITLAGLTLPSLAAGAVFVEKVFSWPGMGLVTVNAIASRDYPLVTAGVLMISVIVVIGALVTDVLIALADPRIRLR